MIFSDFLRRPTALAVAGLMLLASAVPILVSRSASAYTLLGDREIRLSSSEANAAGVTYRVNFEIASTSDIGGIVVTFCENTPIIGDTSCTVPTDFVVSNTFANGDAGDVDVSTWSAAASEEATTGTGNNTFTLTTATPATALAAGNSVDFEITGVNNPSDTGTFYARIMTYGSDTNANGYTVADPEAVGAMIDAGGIALSTADLITVQAKVQERITFCVYAASGAPAYDLTDCNAVTDPVVLGDANGVLDSISPSISKEAKYNITTNASTGATIRMKGGTLISGSFSIDSVGGTAVVSNEGNEQFGFCNYRDTGGGVAGLTPTAPYNNGNCAGTTQGQGTGNDNNAQFAFDLDNVDPEGRVDGAYGDVIASKTAGDWSTGVLVFLGNIDNTTEPGIYVTTLDFIATGRY